MINAALDEQALDMDRRDELDGSFISIDETSDLIYKLCIWSN